MSNQLHTQRGRGFQALVAAEFPYYLAGLQYAVVITGDEWEITAPYIAPTTEPTKESA